MSIDALEGYGLERMSDDEIRSFLTVQGVGVLGLPNDPVPYLLPMSYGFDGDDHLYFTYLVGPESQKDSLSDRVDVASFLVYQADSTFNWESVLLEGRIEALSTSEWEALGDATDGGWRPELFTAGSTEGNVSFYEFTIDDQTGIKHTGLPPGFER